MKKFIKAYKQQRRNTNKWYHWQHDQKLTDDLERELIKAYSYYGMR